LLLVQVQPRPAAVSRARADLHIGRDGRRQPSQNRSAFSSRNNVADPDLRSGAFLTRDPGWVKKSGYGSGINIPDPQHFLEITCMSGFPFLPFVDFLQCTMSILIGGFFWIFLFITASSAATSDSTVWEDAVTEPRARIFKLLRSPGIDSKLSISPAYM
jgi:hypothetical protein